MHTCSMQNNYITWALFDSFFSPMLADLLRKIAFRLQSVVICVDRDRARARTWAKQNTHCQWLDNAIESTEAFHWHFVAFSLWPIKQSYSNNMFNCEGGNIWRFWIWLNEHGPSRRRLADIIKLLQLFRIGHNFSPVVPPTASTKCTENIWHWTPMTWTRLGAVF